MNPFTSFAIMSILYAVKMEKEYTCERRSESTHGKPCDMCIPGKDKNKGCGSCYRNMCLIVSFTFKSRKGYLLDQRTIGWLRGIDLVSLV